jgi:hypothetical protein
MILLGKGGVTGGLTMLRPKIKVALQGFGGKGRIPLPLVQVQG